MLELKRDSLIKMPSFWISQLAIVLATVVGVYLAANQGFEKAMLFDDIRNYKNNYYLRLSLKNEIEANLKILKEYTVEMRSPNYNISELRLNSFVWDGLKYSQQALETPSDLLSSAQNFYYNVNRIMNTSHYHRSKKAELLDELINDANANLIPAFDKDLEELKLNLKKHKVEI